MTNDEKEQGGLAVVRALVEDGASPAQLKAYLDGLDAPDEQGVAAERGRIITLPTGHQLVAESGANAYRTEILALPATVESLRAEDFIPGDHALSAEAQLVNLVRPRGAMGGLNAAAEQMLTQAEGNPEMAGELPLPGDTLSLEEMRARVVIAQAAPSQRFSGVMGAGLPIPE